MGEWLDYRAAAKATGVVAAVLIAFGGFMGSLLAWGMWFLMPVLAVLATTYFGFMWLKLYQSFSPKRGSG